jgi:hypothetical protein
MIERITMAGAADFAVDTIDVGTTTPLKVTFNGASCAGGGIYQDYFLCSPIPASSVLVQPTL